MLLLLPLWFISFTLLLQCTTTIEGTGEVIYGKRPDVHWYEIWSFVSIPSDELASFKKRSGISEHEMMNHPEKPNVYRVPAKYQNELKKMGYNILKDPPFKLVFPEINQRKGNNARDWWNGYKDEELTIKILYDLEKRYPHYAKVYEIGISTEHRPIHALLITKDPGKEWDRPAFLINGAHHGNELISIDYVLHAAKEILSHTESGGELKKYADQFEIWFVPIVNPDGVNIFWNRTTASGRKNARDTTQPNGWNIGDGVDLNRNYPFYFAKGGKNASSNDPSHYTYRGPKEASEPETKAMMDLAEDKRFVVALSFHTFATKVLVPYTMTTTMSPYPTHLWKMAKRMTGSAKSERSDKPYVTVKNLYPVDGTDQDWLYYKYGTSAFIVEGSYQSPVYQDALKSVRGMLPMIWSAFAQYLDGPVVIVHITDEKGQPIEAMIKIKEYVYFENEVHTTHPRKGRYDFFLHSPGEVTIEARKEGYRTENKLVTCSSGICPVTLILKRSIK